MLLNLTASQMISASQLDNGDSLTFDFILDLPRVGVDQKSDLVIELFAIDPAKAQTRGFHMCQVLMDPLGAEIEAVQTHPVYTFSSNYPPIVRKLQ